MCLSGRAVDGALAALNTSPNSRAGSREESASFDLCSCCIFGAGDIRFRDRTEANMAKIRHQDFEAVISLKDLETALLGVDFRTSGHLGKISVMHDCGVLRCFRPIGGLDRD